MVNIQKYTDDFLGILIISSAVVMIFTHVEVPEWFVIIIGMVGSYFFKKVK